MSSISGTQKAQNPFQGIRMSQKSTPQPTASQSTCIVEIMNQNGLASMLRHLTNDYFIFICSNTGGNCGTGINATNNNQTTHN